MFLFSFEKQTKQIDSPVEKDTEINRVRYLNFEREKKIHLSFNNNNIEQMKKKRSKRKRNAEA